ncbi:MAG: VWA domain-containing protein, partial [Sphingomicrobium sp.]
MNEEAGAVWIKRLTDAYPSAAWINPTPEAYWGHSASTAILKRLMNERMYSLTLDGLDEAMRDLSRKR